MLALLVPLAYMCLRYRHGRVGVTVLRLLLYAVLVLGMSGLTWRMPADKGVCIAVVDRSLSMKQDATNEMTAYLKELDKSRPEGAKLGIVSYSADANVEKKPDELPFTGLNSFIKNKNLSLLAPAIDKALGLIPEKSGGHIIVLGDGQWNGPDIHKSMARAAARGITVDYRIWPVSTVRDLSIDSLEAPLVVYEGDSYCIDCIINSPVACNALVKFGKGLEAYSEKRIALHRGINNIAWQDTGKSTGTARYTVSVMPEELDDPCLENNTAQIMVTVKGRKSVLLISNSSSGNLGRLLKSRNYDVKVVAPGILRSHPELLAGSSCVFIENVSATDIGVDILEILASMIREGRLGVVMSGGQKAFANGGYSDSPLEDILPVELKQRNEERKATIALLVVLDRSGSMAMSVSGALTKMDLANRASCEVLRMLLPNDEFGALAVDSSAHVVVPMGKITNAASIEERLMKIESMGGGIFTYTALKEAAKEMKKSNANVKHVILFADAADAEEPGECEILVPKMADAGITVSAIGLGADTDSDAWLLSRVAELGQGQVYFTDKAEDLPRVFAEDTYQVALKMFIQEKVTGAFLQPIRELADGVSGTLSFDGYNLCFPKKGNAIAMVAQDDDKSPLIAFGHAGLGRCSALMFEVDGAFSGDFASDERSASIIGGVVNWTMADDADTADYSITQSLRNGSIHLELALDPERESDPFSNAPEVSTVIWDNDNPGAVEHGVFAWTSPDCLEFETPISGNSVVFPAVKIAQDKIASLAPMIQTCSPEYVRDAKAPERLIEFARATGGVEQFRAERIWKKIPVLRLFFDASPFWALLAVALLLLEVADRRFAFLEVRKKNLVETVAETVPEPKRIRENIENINVAPVEKSDAAETTENTSLSSALKKAKR